MAATAETVLKWLSVFAPAATLLTALTFWFGWTMTNARSSYFGIDASVLGYTAADYVLRSADAMLVPAIVVLLLVLVGICMHAVVRSVLQAKRRLAGLRVAALVSLALGSVLAAAGYWAVFLPLPVETHFLFAPGALGGGVVAVSYSLWILATLVADDPQRVRSMPLWERSAYVVVTILVVLCLFWGSSLYAAALGVGRAQALERNLDQRPRVELFSKQSLATGASIRETVIAGAASNYQFRYSGLRLLVRSSGKYFLLSDGWSRQTGVALIVEDSAEIRVELRPGG